MIRRGVLADSGPLFAAVDTSDQYHQHATDDVARLRSEQHEAVILTPVLCEAYALMPRRLDRTTAGAWLAQVVSSAALVNPHVEDYRTAIQLFERFQDQTITLTDAVLAVVSQRARLPVLTYDHHFDVMRIDV